MSLRGVPLLTPLLSSVGLLLSCTQPFDAGLLGATVARQDAGSDAAGGGAGDAAGGAASDAMTDAMTDAGADASHCGGCWDLECRPGDTASACGREGAACQVCSGATPECFEGACVGARAPVSIVAGGATACLITAERQLYCWGANGKGQAIGGTGPADRASRAFDFLNVQHVAINSGLSWPHSCVTSAGGELACYGSNYYGQVGLEPSPDGTPPNRIAGEWGEVAAGSRGTCAVDAALSVYCWGDRLGTVGWAPRQVFPSGEWRGLSAAGGRACAIQTSEADALYCWGYQQPGAPVGGAGWVQVAVGEQHTCGLRTDQRLYCWGRNTSGELGLEPTTHPSVASPEVVSEAHFIAVAVGLAHTCGVQADGSLWCWGANGYGQLGLGDDEPVVGLQRVGESTGWRAVALGAEFSCGLDADRVVSCWGRNSSAQTTQPRAVTRVYRPTPIRYAD